MFKIRHHINGEFDNYRDLVLARIKNIDIIQHQFPDNTYDIHLKEYDQADKAADIFLNTTQNPAHIGILVDVDVDGYSSSAILNRFIHKYYPHMKITLLHHSKKSHGLTDEIMNKIPKHNFDLLLLPDSSSNDINQIKTISDSGCSVIVLDHHEISNPDYYKLQADNIALINNQSKNNLKTNKHMTGSALSLRFVQMIKDIEGMLHEYEYYDLAAIGLLGDMADYSDYEVRNIVFKGLENIFNPLLLSILQHNDITTPTPSDIMFKVNPLINAVTRVGSMRMKQDVLAALISDSGYHQKHFVERKRKKGKKFIEVIEEYNQYEYIHYLMQQTKDEQNKLVQQLESEYVEKIQMGGIAIGIIDEQYTGITGLVANKIMDKTKRPVILLRDKENELRGSARGYKKTISSFRDWCLESGLVEFAEGHDNAFGIKIEKSNIDNLLEYSKHMKKEEKIYDVDITFSENYPIDTLAIDDLISCQELTGGSIPKIQIGLQHYPINKENIKVYNTMTKIKLHDNIFLVLFNDNGEIGNMLKEDFEHSNMLTNEIYVDLVGSLSINKWGWQQQYQIIVDDLQFHKQDVLINKSPKISNVDENEPFWLF